jgi:hypothetical protein
MCEHRAQRTLSRLALAHKTARLAAWRSREEEEEEEESLHRSASVFVFAAGNRPPANRQQRFCEETPNVEEFGRRCW